MKTDPSIFKKADNEKQIVWAEVYVPNVPDSQGDFMTPDDIEYAAYNFMRAGNLMNIDINHDNRVFGAYVVESFIAREEDKIFIPGAWVVAVHIPDEEVWGMVKNGELNGFSLQALAVPVDEVLELDIPPTIQGVTSEDAGHVHKFTVHFDKDGKFLGGETDEVDGHRHKIVRGTVTEEVDGHKHKFSFVELLVNIEEQGDEN